MYGRDVETFNIKTRTMESGPMTTIYTNRGSVKDAWMRVEVPLSSTADFQVCNKSLPVITNLGYR